MTTTALAKVFSSPDGLSSKTRKKFLSNIRVLKIPSLTYTDDTLEPSAVARIVSGMLACTSKLEVLTLSEVCQHNGQSSCISVVDLFGRSLHLTNLAKLELWCCLTCKEHEIVEFFRRHASTLIDVNLKEVEVGDEIAGRTNWSTVLTHLRDLTFPLLTKFLLRH